METTIMMASGCQVNIVVVVVRVRTRRQKQIRKTNCRKWGKMGGYKLRDEKSNGL
ncbi:transmembrane protein, putative [Medicago truncatula]|uniref:Transmembrane protein, putative n=1 Tax=Medicago truncatula TaxID=3880 RepID=A0A072TK37_MEDTR|nr:transmembrane protein, putative [Medicago truncatula]